MNLREYTIFQAGRLSAVGDFLSDTATSPAGNSIAAMIRKTAELLLLDNDAPATPAERPVELEELAEELALGEVETVPDAVAMLLGDRYTTARLAAAVGCPLREITAAADGHVTARVNAFFRPLMPAGNAETEEE